MTVQFSLSQSVGVVGQTPKVAAGAARPSARAPSVSRVFLDMVSPGISNLVRVVGLARGPPGRIHHAMGLGGGGGTPNLEFPKKDAVTACGRARSMVPCSFALAHCDAVFLSHNAVTPRPRVPNTSGVGDALEPRFRS